MIIKNIFSGKMGEDVHREFLKFGKGEYKRKYQIQAKKQGEITIIKTSNEFANYFVRKCLEKVHEDIDATGVVVSTFDLKNDAPFPIERTKNFMGIRQLVINSKLNPHKVLEFMKRYPTVFFALSFKTEDFELKIKPKAPKSAKPSTKSPVEGEEEEIKVDFCILKTQDKDLLSEFFFDIPSFKEVSITHTLKIQEIKYPKDFAKMKPEEVREKSVRKGILIREMNVDGRKERKEAGFEA
jgi:hypothetical protein